MPRNTTIYYYLTKFVDMNLTIFFYRETIQPRCNTAIQFVCPSVWLWHTCGWRKNGWTYQHFFKLLVVAAF